MNYFSRFFVLTRCYLSIRKLCDQVAKISKLLRLLYFINTLTAGPRYIHVCCLTLERRYGFCADT